jgi:ribosomal protein L11 methyltransferase
MKKPLWKVSVATTLEAEDAVAEMLGEIFGCPVSSYFDLEKKSNRLTAFVSSKISQENREKVQAGLKHVQRCGLEIGPGKISIARVPREDWTESWKRHFKPIDIHHRLLVKPGWSKKRPQKNQAVVILNPGLSFGTGQHPTTLFCLQELVRNFARLKSGSVNPSFLDIGTGSGILAIAAAKLGYRDIRAMDFDPEAVRVARANARSNRVLPKINIYHGDVAKLPLKPKKRHDLICANLISNLLIEQRHRIIAQLNRGGVLVLAGILKSEFGEVQKTYEKLGLKTGPGRSKKEWKSGSFSLA